MTDVAKSALAELAEETGSVAGEGARNGRTAPASHHRGGRGNLVARARAYVATVDPAVSGQAGHAVTWRVARKLAQDFQLSEEQTFSILWSDYNPRCQPPWGERELRHKAREAVEKARVTNPVDEQEHWRMPDTHYAENDSSPVRSARREATTVAEVIDSWLSTGPLVHEPTGIARLDELTGGGPVYGSRWYLAGAPDAGKTALLLQIAHTLAQRGVCVGLLAVDEDPSDVVTRLAQRVGYSRHHCEARDSQVLENMQTELGGLSLRFYDAAWTIEAAAADVVAHAAGRRVMLGIDSVQTVSCDAEAPASGGRELSEVAAVTARVRAIRDVATRHGLIAMATSEFGRSAYSSSDRTQQSSTMASGKWSGAIEYSARVLLGLRSVSGEADLVELDVAKNKHGPRDETVYLKIDRRAQTLTATAYEPPPKSSAKSRDSATLERVAEDGLAVARALRAQPGLGAVELRSVVKATCGFGHARTDAALAFLGNAVMRGKEGRGKTPMTLDTARLPDALRDRLESDHG